MRFCSCSHLLLESKLWDRAACGYWLENTDFDSVVVAVRDARDRHACKLMCEEHALCNAAVFLKESADATAVSGACHFKVIEEHTVANPDVAAASIRLC